MTESHVHQPTRLALARLPAQDLARYGCRVRAYKDGLATDQHVRRCSYSAAAYLRASGAPLGVMSPDSRTTAGCVRMPRSAVHHMPAQEERHDRQAAFDQRFCQPRLA
ncbi:conserved hypothetical protein [Xanthomonas oryzae pv. oryzae MAFF 311018]|nr:conserved hypothetical protein [Xanthomonas oryzae pv. oryzae MAFF 311018]